MDFSLAATPDRPPAEPGHLYIVATPLGNMGDISSRAVALLGSVDCIACEDTRVTQKLLTRLAISPKRLLSYREENEIKQSEALVALLKEGHSVALVADAGTPTMSDPGFRLVRLCRKMGIAVHPIPGPCAAIAALCASGLPTDGFYFVGFLPNKASARCRFFEHHKSFPNTIIIYESCHRIQKCLNDLIKTLGQDRTIALAREITKLHETFLLGPAERVLQELEQSSKKGEFVLMIAPQRFTL